MGQTFIAKAQWWTSGEWGCLLYTLSAQGFPYCRDWGMPYPLLPKNLFVSTGTQKCWFCEFYAVISHFALNIPLSRPLIGNPDTYTYDHNDLYYLNTPLYLIDMILRLYISDDKFMTTYNKFINSPPFES